MARVKFVDVYGGGLGTYEWAIGHSDEDAAGATMNISLSAPTGGAGAGFIRQIGDPEPFRRALKGTILERAQLQALWRYFYVCGGLGPGPQRTIHWFDQLGSEFEVLFYDFRPQAVRTVRNDRGTTADERLVYWTYDMGLEIVNVIADWP